MRGYDGNMKKDPLVSIITTVFNGEKYLVQCIQSVLEQNYPFIEHIFIDGASSDHTVEILEHYHTKYPDRIKYLSEPDCGPCDAWNKGLKLAQGDIMGWLGSDDLYTSQAIETVVNVFVSKKECHFVYGRCMQIDGNCKDVGEIDVREFNLHDAINNKNLISTTSAFYSREVIDKVGFMDTSIYICDHDYWIRVGKKFKMYKINELLSKFRVHDLSISGSPKINKRYAKESFLINRRYGGNLFSLCTLRYALYLIVPPLILEKLLDIWRKFKRLNNVSST